MTEFGTVAWYNPMRGYGFILRDGLQPSDPNSQIFVHVSALATPNGQLTQKQRVSFEIIAGKRPGTIEAMNVHILPK
jgi:CspA family cold shock protein